MEDIAKKIEGMSKDIAIIVLKEYSEHVKKTYESSVIRNKIWNRDFLEIKRYRDELIFEEPDFIFSKSEGALTVFKSCIQGELMLMSSKN